MQWSYTMALNSVFFPTIEQEGWQEASFRPLRLVECTVCPQTPLGAKETKHSYICLRLSNI